MIRLILVSLFLHGSQANHCFDRANSNSCFLVGKMMSHQRVEAMMQITNYHCIMKCANMLSKATMDLALDNMHEKFNHQCILIDNLDYCLQYWKQIKNVDCEVPIKKMVQQNFQVSNTSRVKETL